MNLQELAPLAAFVGAYAFLRWLLRGGHLWLPLDLPNARSLHGTAIPRVGGLAIMPGLALGIAQALAEFPVWLALALLLAAISFLDDRRGLPVGARFAAHILAAAWFTWWAYPAGAFIVQLGLVMAIVWMTNLYNFMDGSDGLAGGMAVFGFGFYGLAAALAEGMGFALACWSIAAAALAFLRFNFHPACVFMGDAGSIPLGFLAAGLGILGWRDGLWPIHFPLLVFSPFIVDATVTLTRRALRGEKVWQAHKSHYYQRLVQSGLGHRATALWEYALMLACGLSALATLIWPGLTLPVLLAWAAIYSALMWAVDRRWRMHVA